MNEVLAGPVLAANEISAGTAGLFVVVLLCIASGFIFYFMSGSLKRMRSHVEDGDFAAADARRRAAKAGEGEPAEASHAQAATIPAQSTGAPPDA
ncbi:hypothetical protein I6A60_04765 [Frankia sp. AgB1.9]|uniref:hypothetical protein n=1 Tax=unclassified Frankia TaxID=2632575 RepID=UPI001931F44A|nr:MULTISPECIES: hypothetical protein [unclassified Frankia]MBL7487828.1 hypothetical protein [Frankia sp. AgW1.1]MBL7547192.1 hypothetical protein [Frankia sp. AgB1.9]MBL7620130.1 hypothetical protein [Frankia sp. AgB1.8]